MNASSRFQGVGVALVTPMHADGSIDWSRFDEHVEFQIDGGLNYLVPCGTTGESATLLPDEQEEVIRRTVTVAAGRVPIMAGASSNRTASAVEMAIAAQTAGADAVLSVSPYYNKPTQEGIFQHYRAIATAVDIPVIVYNVPSRTSSNVLPETLFRLAEVPNIGGVKEASGDLDQARRILDGRPEAFFVLSGEDSLTLAMLEMGGDGAISVVANETPKLFADLVNSALNGEVVYATSLHERLLPLMEANFLETNPIPVKAALEMMGRMDAHMRLPLTPLSEQYRPPLRDALKIALRDTEN